MRKFKSGVALIGAVLAASVAGLAGCGGSNADEANTPSDAVTAVNSAVQTDAKGNFVTVEGAGGGETTEVDPAVAAGKTVFEANCQGCHANGGAEAGVGPKLVGAGLTKERIETQVKKGGGAMPAFDSLPKADLDNVVAFVASLQ